MRTAIKSFKKTILLLLAFYVIPLGLFCQTIGIIGDSTINRCEVKSYTISIQNNSGNPLTNLVIVARLENLIGFSYVTGTTSIDVNGGGAFCTANPAISGGYSGTCAPAPGVPYLTWDIDAQCPGSPFTLSNGDTLNITFQLETDCTAVSGSLNTYIDYTLPGPTPMCDDTGVLNIRVNPGAVTIKKTANVIPQVLGQDVTWTLTVENTGFGVIENVEVTDVLGVGLAYVSSTQNGNNSGQTTTWTANEYAALASMDPGDILTMDITATVIACENLDNEADVRFGCDPSPTNTCFDTSVDGGTARASVQRIVRTPNIEFTPPDINFTYCSDTENISFTITNIGDGIAYDVYTIVDFGSLIVSNVSAGAIYNNVDKRFELAVPLAASGDPGDSYNLSFDLTYSTWCGSFPSGDLLWQELYKDECDQDFFPPVELSTINPPAASSSLSVSKNGAGAVIQIGDPVTYTVTSSYSGPINCGSGTTSDITVVDTVPNGFTVTDAGGGVWVPGGGGTGGTITWTYTPPASLNTTVTFQSPPVAQCETYCNTTFTNSITASGIDCCGCALNTSDSETTAIECAEGVTSDKTSTSPTERCDDTTYTNTYNFSGGSGVVLSDLQFEEHAELQQVYNGNLTIMLGAANITGCVAVTDNTPGGSLLLDFSGCAATSLAGQTLTITYDLTATANTVAACTSGSFYSWSSLDMGPSGSNCLGDGIIHETTVVNVGSPSMSLSITGLGQIFHTCETKTITMTLTQTSANTNPKDVKLVLSGLNYYVVNPAATICGGVAPVSCTPTIDGSGDYIWEFGDAFTGSGQSATIQLEVQKRCGGIGDLVATAYFDDRCTDDATADELCSVVATETPALLLSGDLLIEKTPETYYAVTNQVQWEIYVTNRGTGTAYNVWVDDVLGSGLLYEHGVNPVVVDDMTGVTINDSLDHNGGAINGASVEITSMAAGERRQITFIARQVDCNNLTNDVSASWGCIGVDCQTAVTDNSIVNIPAPNLINTNTITPAGGVDACSSPDGFITLRNAGQITCYNLQVTETLPPNLLYVSGSTRWRLNGGGWNGPDVAYDPNPTVSPLVWTSTEIPGLATSTPGDTIEIEFDMTADCPFTGGDISVSTQYENPCADVFTTAISTFTAAFNAPDITIDKTRANDPIDCNDAIQWTITVTNNSGYTLPIIWIEDTMDATFTYASSVGDPPYTSDNGTNVGQVVTWELRNVNQGDTVTLILNATTDSAPCSPDLDNTVIAYWGCGAADGSSATKPGVDPPDNTLCLTSTGVTDVRTETRQPDLTYLSIAMSPGNIDACNDSTQLTIVMENTGPVDAYTIDLAITLPTGITYNAGTAESGLGTDTPSATAAIGAIGDPAISGSTITFYDFGDKGSNLAPVIQAAGGNDTLVLRFTVQSACYVTDDLDFDLRFYDCCDDTQYSETTSQTLTALFPSLTVTKTANLSQVDCGSNVEYTIQVTNNGTGNAEVIRVVDTLGDWLDYAGNFTEDQPGTITLANIGGNPQIVGWEFNDLGPGATATFTFEATLNPDGLPNQNDCTAALRQNNVTAQWACGTSGDATDGDPNTTGYDCTDSGSTTAGPVTLEIPNLVVTSITPDVSCTSDGNFSGTISVRVTNNGDGDTSGTFTVEVTDGKGWTGTGTYGLAIAAGAFADVTINTATWTPDCQPCAAPYSFNATVDLNNNICECNETDNDTSSATTYTVPSPDLAVDSNALAVVCADDNQVTITGTVTLINNGCNTAVTSNIPMRFTLYDNTGCGGGVVEQWTDTFSSANIAAGGGTQAFTITNHTFTSNQCLDSTSCQVSIFVEADYNDSICECDGTNNTYCADNIAVDIPDLAVDNDTLTVTCLDDGQVTVSGTVTLANNGCGSNLNSNIPMRFTLYDNTGCAGNQLDQWTQTFAGVNIASGGGTQVFTITPQSLTTNMVINSTNCQVSILVEADYNDTICECDGTNNTYCADNKPVDIPDIEVLSDTLDFTCTDDGQFRVTGTVTAVNNGCGSNLTDNIPVRFTLFDNTGCSGNQLAQWTETFSSVNIPASGGTQVFTITPYDMTANICNNSTNCQVSILVEMDYINTICESDGTDNTWCSDKTLNIPELTINSVASTVVCLDDGNLAGTTVNVSNTGCGDAAGVVVRLASGCGLTFTDQTVNLAAGETTDVFFPFTAGITTCTCSFTATIDPDNVICECDGTNNTQTSLQDMLIPDLEVQSEALVVTCLDDGVIQVSGTVTLVNNGCGPDFTGSIPMRFTLFNRTGCIGSQVDQWTQNFTGATIASAGGTQTFTIQPHDITTNFCTNSSNCQVSIRIEADYNNTICEWDGTDNTYCTNKTSDCLDLEAASVEGNTNCVEDADLNGTIAVTVRNSGGNPITSDFYVRVDDGQGWSSELRYNADLGGTLPLTAGASSTVTFEWNRTFEIDTCEYTNITAQVDSQNEICQCTTENDTTSSSSYQMPLPNLKPTAITPGCSADGSYLVQVTIENNGCSDAGTFTIHLEDNLGNSMDVTVDSLAKGASTTVDFNEWPATCDPASVTFTVFVDFNNNVCEITGTDNTMEQVYTNTSPDLVITDVKPSATCRSPGDINGMFEITLQNNGNGPANEDFKIIVNDGEGWNTEKFYQADLNGTLPIGVGDTVTLRVNWNSDFTEKPFTCNFNNITISLDMLANVCECAAGNNDVVVTYNLTYPDLVIQSLLPICNEDGQRQVQLTIGNEGCENQNEDFNITFTDSTGQTRTVSFTSMGGTLPLKKGSPQTVTLTQWEFDCTEATTDYTAAISHEAGGCDLLDTNNTLTLPHTMEEPDLLFGDIQWTCNVDGSITFTVTVSNNGFGDAAGVPVHIYDSNGSLVYNQTVVLPKGSQKQFSFTTDGFPQDQNLTFRFVVDETDNYCECDGSNNEKSISFVCPSTGQEPPLKISKSCPPGQQPGGLFRFEIQVENTGETDLTNARIEDFLPQGFQYVSGSSAFNGQALSDPQISDRLTWTIGTLNAGETMTLVFSAVADADIDPGRYCNETQAVATLYGDVVTVTTDKVQCCTVVVRQARAGCCLKVEEWALEPGQIPDGPLSFIEPYFHTESAMITIYSIFNLWQDTELEKGAMPLFMKKRLHNYARSTIEEFYLDSQLGLTQADGTLWLSYAGAYPERGNSWLRKQVNQTMTASQLGFELLALNEAVNVEERQEVKQKLNDIIEKKLTFLTYFIADLPHAWEIKEKKKGEAEVEVTVKVEEAIEKHIKKQDEKATLYDKVALYLAMVELKKNGYSNTNIGNFEKKLREMLKNIDNRNFDANNLREEFLFTLALLESGENEQAKAKINEFESIFNGAAKTREETRREVLDNLHDYALAAAVDYKADGTAYKKIMQQAKEKFYLKDTGVFAEKQPDFTFKLKLHSLAPMILAFDTNDPEKQESYATVLYRTFDEVGLFLKKRNLSIGKPLYSLLKNYPFTEPLLPVLNFTKANQDIAPVFSRDAVIHSTQLKPIGEILIPQTFSKILSPSYETTTSRIAAVSFGLQYFGRTLMGKNPWVIKEEGRSLNETGKTYVDSLLKSGAGIQFKEKTLLPFDEVALKGPKKGEHNLEPLNAGTGAEISTKTLANYLLAENLYVQGKGKYADTVRQIMAYQDRVVKQFKDTGYIPETFTIFIENDTEKITVTSSKTMASKLTVAKLFHVLSRDDNHKFLESALKETEGKLMPEDLIFLAAVPELVPYFEKEIQILVDYKDSSVSYNTADIVGRRLLGDKPDKIQESLENLKKHWDKEAVLPKSDLIENIERGLIYHHEPRQLLLYLLATYEEMDFRFERTLNFFTYLLENEWGVAWNSFITLPSARFQVFREKPKEHVEPGDLLSFRVRVDNTCPEGFGSAHDLPSLYLKAAFTPSLIYAGTQRVDGLDVVGDFQWRYSGLVEGSVLEYIYQALVPKDFSTNFVNGWIYAGGRQGFEEFGPESAVGDECEDIDQVRRLNIIPFQEIQGLVYEDTNVNGIKDVGERGIPNILIKDTRGRLFRSDGEGRFTVLAGDQHEGIQVELKSIPANYLLISKPTRLVNRNYIGEIYFGLIPCKTVTGFVYMDENQNGAYDEGEPRPEGVLLKAKYKEVITGKDGNFIFRNLPTLWRQWIEVKREQLYYKGNVENLGFYIEKE